MTLPSPPTPPSPPSPLAPLAQPELAHDVAWQRLDPRMLLVHPVRELIRFVPVLIGVVVAGSSGGGWESWQVIGVALPIVLGLLRYLTTSFRIAAGRVELRRGLLSRHTLSTPLDRVRTVDLTASPIHRLLGLTTVRIGTGNAAKDKDEALDLDGLPVARARELRRELLGESAVSDRAALTASASEETLVRFHPSWLRYAPLTGSGLVIAAASVGGGFQLIGTLGLGRRLDRAHWSLPVPPGVAVAVGLLLALLLVAALSVVGYLVANGGFRLTRAGGAFHVRRGLLTTRETSLDEDRVAGVCVGEPLTLRLAGAAHLTAIVSGVDRGERGSATLVPPAPAELVARTAADAVGALPVTTGLVGHGPAAVRRRWTRALVPAGIVAAVLTALGLTVAPSWLLGPAAAILVAGVVLAADRAAGLGHALVEGHLVARSGSLARHREILAAEHVIGWTLRSTGFQRRLGLTTLVATTAGGRQRVVVLDVPEREAVSLAAAAVPGLVEQFAAPP